MQSTLSTLFDSHHILHPKQMDNIGDHHEPTLLRRILGVVLLALSLPLTLGVAPAFFAYWAHRKVVHVEQRDQTELQEKTTRLFGERVQGEESSEEQKTFETVFKAVQQGRSLQALPDEMDNDLAKELMDAALEHDNVAAFIALIKKYGMNSQFNITKVKSIGMIREIMKERPKDEVDVLLKDMLNPLMSRSLHSNLAAIVVVKECVKAGAKCPSVVNFADCEDPEVAKYLMEKFSAEFNEEVAKGTPSPLFFVQNAEVLKALIEGGFDVQALNSEGDTIINYFIFDPLKSNPEMIDLILEKIPDVEEKKQFVNKGNPLQYVLPLHVVKVLVEAGAECPSTDVLRKCEDPELAKYLMEKFSAEFNQKVVEGEASPLFSVQNAEVLKALIEGGLDVRTEDLNGRTILHRMGEPAFRDHPELVSLIVGKVDENKRDAFVNHVAQEPKHSPLTLNPGPKMIKALQEAGAIYPRFQDGRTFLHFGISLETVKALVEAYGVDIVNQKDDQGFTPIFSPHILGEVAAYLIEQGADLTLTVKLGKNPPMNALFFAKDVAVAKALIDGGINPQELDTLDGNALFGFISPEVAQYLIKEYELKVDAKDTFGKEPIHYKNDLEMAKVLIGDRRSDHDWGENKPPVMENAEFIAWLQQREAQQSGGNNSGDESGSL